MDYIDFHTHQKTAEGVITPRSFGIHPWKADQEKAESYDAFKNKSLPLFANAQIIGECGLDKVCRSNWETQMRLFEWQIMMADELNKPMVVHCVRAFNELTELRKKHRHNIWVVHGFAGSTQLADQLYKAGIWVSYGAALLDPKREKVRESLRCNRNPYLLETDDSDVGIAAVYKSAAETTGLELKTLADTIKERYTTLFA
ncbi:MAG: TatD family hydrolase [Bacteroidales bacterium]|nr:TatD family hydrolase [Bacteroidales bacterium]